MIRRFGESPRGREGWRHRAGVYAILPRGRQILITRQADPEPEFQLPGGGVDPGETPLRALHREVWEETGWTIARPRRLGAFRRFTFMPDYGIWAEKLCAIYVAHPARSLAPAPEVGHEALWMPVELAVRELAVAGDRHFVRRLMGAGA